MASTTQRDVMLNLARRLDGSRGSVVVPYAAAELRGDARRSFGRFDERSADYLVMRPRWPRGPTGHEWRGREQLCGVVLLDVFFDVAGTIVTLGNLAASIRRPRRQGTRGQGVTLRSLTAPPIDG